MFENYGMATSAMINLVNEKITKAQLDDNYSIMLKFSNNNSIKIVDDSEQYESFIIKNGEDVLVF